MSRLTKTEHAPYIAVIGSPLQPVDHVLVIEQKIVIKHIDVFGDVVAMFLALIYVLNLNYNTKLTFEFLQRGLLRLDDKAASKKVTNILAKLIK